MLDAPGPPVALVDEDGGGRPGVGDALDGALDGPANIILDIPFE